MMMPAGKISLMEKAARECRPFGGLECLQVPHFGRLTPLLSYPPRRRIRSNEDAQSRYLGVHRYGCRRRATGDFTAPPPPMRGQKRPLRFRTIEGARLGA